MNEVLHAAVATRDGQTSARVEQILAGLSLEQKLAQLVGFWVDYGGDMVAPMAGEMPAAGVLERAIEHGLGQLTRVFGTRPVEPNERAAWLRSAQRRLLATGPGLPALVHEECLTGLAAWQAATFPTPLAWGASFDPDLVAQMAGAIGRSMRQLGIHQGLAPVLDVIRDPRWGRVDECIAEDPYLVGTIGTSYVRGLQGAGVVATLKHFVGYSASRAGRNLAPVHAGPREVADVLLVPFEMALLDGGARSVMHSYTEIDGVPVAADPRLLTDLLRDRWGFDGTVVADYFGVAFLHTLHAVAADLGEAAAQALAAGVDVELPTGDAYRGPLLEQVRSGRVPEDLVDRAVRRVLRQKEELGLLDETFADQDAEVVDLDPPGHREIAARLAQESVVLLANDGVLPLVPGVKVAVVGPNADHPNALFGCYSFANHVLAHHPDVALGIEVPTVLEALRTELAAVWGAERAVVTSARGCDVDGSDRSGFDEAVAVAAAADVVVVVAGDEAGLFGRGTVGEGNDVDDLELPGVQRAMVEAVVATGVPVVLVLLTGRPYAIDWALAGCAAVVQAYFPGEEGGAAIAGVLSGRVNPSGRLPVSMPRAAGRQPYSYLHPALGGDSEVSSQPTGPALPFGFGLSYTTFAHSDLQVAGPVVAGGTAEVSVRVANTGHRAGDDVVQLYGHDLVASVTRPVAQLLGYARVHLAAGQSAVVHLSVPTTRLALSDRTMVRVVEPGAVDLWVGPSCEQRETSARLEVTGEVHRVGPDDERWVQVTISPA